MAVADFEAIMTAELGPPPQRGRREATDFEAIMTAELGPPPASNEAQPAREYPNLRRSEPPATRQPARPPTQQPAPAVEVEQQEQQPAKTEFEFEGRRYSFSPEYDNESIARWLNQNVMADRRKLSREKAGGRSQAYDSEQEQKLHKSTPVGQQGLKEWAEFLSGKDEEDNPVIVKPEDVTPQMLTEIAKAYKQQAEAAAKVPDINPVKLREFNEDIAAMERDLERLWPNETTLEHKQRLAIARGDDPLIEKPTASASTRDEAILNTRPEYVVRKDQPREAFWAENLLREYHQEYGNEIPRDKKTAFDNANTAYEAWLKNNPKGSDEEFDEWRQSKPIRGIMHPEEQKRIAELKQDPHDRRYYDNLSEAMVAYHAYKAGDLDIVPYALKRIPFAGTAVEAADFLSLRNAVKNIDGGKATDSDWFTLAGAIDAAEKSKDRSFAMKVWDLASHLPGMGVEFAMTGGGFTAARLGARKLAVKLLGRKLMRRAIPRMAVKTAGFAAGVAGRTALNAPLVAAKVAEKWMPEYDLTRDEADQLTAVIADDGDPSFLEALGKGFGAAYIEMGSEEAGSLVGVAGKALAKSKAGQVLTKMPLAQRTAAMKAALLNRFLAKGGTVAQSKEILRRAGWNGMIGEVFEERLADVAGGATGIEDDYGTMGKLLVNDPEGWEQLAVEATAFATIPAGQTAMGAAEAAMAPKDTRGPTRTRGHVKTIVARARTELEKLRSVVAKGWVTVDEAEDAGLSSEELKNRGSRKAAVQARIQQLEQEIQDAEEVREAEGGQDFRGPGEVEEGAQPAGEVAEGEVGTTPTAESPDIAQLKQMAPEEVQQVWQAAHPDAEFMPVDVDEQIRQIVAAWGEAEEDAETSARLVADLKAFDEELDQEEVPSATATDRVAGEQDKGPGSEEAVEPVEPEAVVPPRPGKAGEAEPTTVPKPADVAGESEGREGVVEAAEESPWAAETRQKLGAVPVFQGASIELDEAAGTAKVTRSDGRATTVHFSADSELAAMAKKKGLKPSAARGAYVYKTGKKGKFQEGDIYLRSDAGHGTLNHEAVHWMEDEGIITPEEVERYGGREGLAKSYGEWAANEQRKPDTFFQRIYDFLEPLFSSQRRFFDEIGKRGQVKSTSTPPKDIGRQSVETGQNIHKALREAGYKIGSKEYRNAVKEAVAEADRIRAEMEANKPENLAARAARGEDVERPEGVHPDRWEAMKKQQAKRLGIKPKKTPPSDIVSRVDSAVNARAKDNVFRELGEKAVPGLRLADQIEAGQWAYMVAKGEVTQAEFDTKIEEWRRENRIRTPEPTKPAEAAKEPVAKQPWTEKATKRIVRGQQRNMVIRTFTGSTSEQYDAFLDSRPEGTEMRRGKSAPVVEIDGRQQYSSYEFAKTEDAAEKVESAKPDVAAIDKTLAQSGLKVEQLKNGTWQITGNTYEHKQKIGDAKREEPELGGRWNPEAKAWTFKRDPRRSIADRISRAGVGEKPTDAGGRLEQVAREDARRREDERTDVQRTGEDYVANVGQDTRDLVARGLKHDISQEVIDNQVEDIGRIVDAAEAKRPMFVLGSAPGTGKTFVLGGAIRELRNRGFERFVYVTQNQDLIAQVQKDLADYGLEGVEFTTYAQIRKTSVDTSGSVLLLDEAHSAKNTDLSTGKTVGKMVKSSQFAVYSTATPFENVVEAEYLGYSGIFDDLHVEFDRPPRKAGGRRFHNELNGFDAWAWMFGANVYFVKRTSKTGRSTMVPVVWWPKHQTAEEDQFAANEWLKKRGVFTQRPMTLPSGTVVSDLREINADQFWADISNEVVDIYAAAEADAKSDVERGQINAHKVNVLKRLLEAAKVDAAIARAKELVGEGREEDPQVIIFVNTKVDLDLGTFQLSAPYRKKHGIKGKAAARRYTPIEMDRMMQEWEEAANAAEMMGEGRASVGPPPFARFIHKIAMAFDRAGVLKKMPSVIDRILEAFPGQAVEYTGRITSDAKNKKNLVDWKANKYKVIVATMDKGGTGLSYHDTTGKMPPRYQVNMNLPWSGTKVDQVSGRLARQGTAKPVHLEWIFANNIPFDRELSKTVGSRMRSMSAAVQGRKSEEAKRIRDFDFEQPEYDARDLAVLEEAGISVKRTPKGKWSVSGLSEEMGNKLRSDYRGQKSGKKVIFKNDPIQWIIDELNEIVEQAERVKAAEAKGLVLTRIGELLPEAAKAFEEESKDRFEVEKAIIQKRRADVQELISQFVGRKDVGRFKLQVLNAYGRSGKDVGRLPGFDKMVENLRLNLDPDVVSGFDLPTNESDLLNLLATETFTDKIDEEAIRAKVDRQLENDFEQELVKAQEYKEGVTLEEGEWSFPWEVQEQQPQPGVLLPEEAERIAKQDKVAEVNANLWKGEPSEKGKQAGSEFTKELPDQMHIFPPTGSALSQASEAADKEAAEAFDKFGKALRSKGAGANLFLDPEVLAAAANLTAKLVKAGVLRFAVAMERMAARFGEAKAEQYRPVMEKAWDDTRAAHPEWGMEAREAEEPVVPPTPPPVKPAAKKPPVEPPHPEQQAAEKPITDDDLTGIKKAIVNEMRETVGLPEMEGSTPQTVLEWVEQAEATLRADPKAAIRLVNELANNPRPIDQHDAMLLQFRYRQLANELKPFVDEFFESVASKDPHAIAIARSELIKARTKMTEFEEIIHPSKETWGRAGVALQQMLKKDFSLGAVLRRGKEANHGEELSPDQIAELTELVEQLEELQKRFDEQRRENEKLKRELASQKQHEEVIKKAKQKKSQPKSQQQQDATARRQAALANFKDKWAALGHVGFAYDPKAEARKQKEALDAAIEVAKAYVAEGFVRFSEFWTSIKGNIKDAAQAEAVFHEAWEQVKTEAGIAEPDLDMSDLKGLSKDARRIQRLLVESGMADREEVIDAVHKIMTEDLPDFTRRQTMDALSQYGQFQTQSQVRIVKLIRDMNAEILKLSQIAQMETALKRVEELREQGLNDEEIGNRLADENLLVKATGLVRDRPTETVRQLTKKYNELKKSIPATSEGVAGRLQTTQDAIVRALSNRIRDVRWEIDHNERIVREKNAPPDTDLIRSLRAELEKLMKIHREFFPPQRKEMTPEQKLAASERAATRLLEFMQKQEEAGFPPSPAKPKPLTSTQLEATRKQIAEIRERRDAAQREGKRLDQLNKQIATLEERLRTGNIAPKVRPTPYTTPMIEARIARRQELQAELEARQKAEMPELAEQRARKAYEASLRKRKADYLQILADGDFSPKPKKEARILSASELKLKREMEDVRHQVLQKYSEYHLAHLNGIAWTADKIMESAHLSRALMTSFDLSALLRQGGLPAMGHPILAKRALFETIASIAYTFDSNNALALREGVTLENIQRFLQTIDSRQAEFDFMHRINSGANGEFRLRAGLDLTGTDEAVTRQEEAFAGRWGKEMPGIAISARLYTMILNKLRADLFDLMVQNLGRGGQVTMDEAKIIASFVNVATGRSDFKQFNKWAAILNTTFFAPRYVASRFQYLAMPFYLPFKGGLKANWRIKRAIYKEFARTAIGIGTVLGTFALAGMLLVGDDDEPFISIELDPRSADFLKVRIGDTRLDFLAGLSQTFVVSTRLLLPEALGGNRTKSSVTGKVTKFGETPFSQTKAKVAERFARSKLAPVPGALATVWLYDWVDVVGQKETPLSLAGNLLLPLSLQDIGEAAQTQGISKTAAMALLSILGVGMNTYGPKTQYVTGTPDERKTQFEKDIDNMEWDSERPDYSEYLTPTQLKQVDERLKYKQGSVINEGLAQEPERNPKDTDTSYQKKLETHAKAQERLQEMIQTLGLDHIDAQQLLVEYYRVPGRAQGDEYIKGSLPKRLEEGYKAKGKALAELYGERDPHTAFWAWRNSFLRKSP